MIHIVLLAGGVSQRLWPLSDEIQAKQFLPLLDADSGEKESMLQRTYRQIQTEFPDEKIVIATNNAQESQIRAQLGNTVSISCEPQRHDTFAAIVLATAFSYRQKRGNEDDVVVVLPVDGYVEQTYFSAIRSMAELAARKVANIVLMGVKPTSPSCHFGYILPASFHAGYTLVERFVEKPTEKVAQELFAKGARWNSGVFAFTVGFLKSIIEEQGQEFSFSYLYDSYAMLPTISFDYAVVEKESLVAMVPYDGFWKDLGTWDSLSSVLGKQGFGQYVKDPDVQSTTIVNNLNIPIVALGTKNLVIAASSKGILVADKQTNSPLKPLVETLSKDKSTIETRVIVVPTGEVTNIPASRAHRTFLVPLAGSGSILLDNFQPLKLGVLLELSCGRETLLRAEEELHLVEVRVLVTS